MYILRNLSSKKRPKTANRLADEIGILRKSPLLDPVWYREISVDLRDTPIDVAQHYLEHGAREGRNPHPLFDTKFYIEQNPDVASSGMNPLVHYILYGGKEGRIPHPAFDVNFYISQVQDFDGLDPLTHYLTIGWKTGANPIAGPPDLDRSAVVNAEAGPAPTNAVHYFQAQIMLARKSSSGLREAFNHLVHRSDHLAPRHFNDLRPDPDEFDEDAYLAAYPDVKNAVEQGAMPSGLEHWLVCGFQEELNGSRDGSWRWAISLSTVKTMVSAVLSKGQNSALEGNEASLPSFVTPYVKRWNKVSWMVQSLSQAPLISVLMPVYNVDVKWLNLAIESVYWQIYPNWELCIVDDCSPNPEISRLLRQWAVRDKRIKVKLRTENGHISAATNDALGIADGSYIALLDHDDELTVDALARVAYYINHNRSVDYIYSDEDKVDEVGNVNGRFFKPAWSPEFVLSCGYTTHLSVYRKAVVLAVGGFRSQYDGAQDYDLTLRVTAATSRVGHIPEVLYHWRTIETSTARGNQAKNYALPRAKAALKEHMARIGFPGEVIDGILPGYTRPVFGIKGDPLVSLIIPTAGKIAEVNGRSVNLLENFVKSICEISTWKNIQLVILENGNLPIETIDDLIGRKALIVPYREEKFNLARKVNLGVRAAAGEYVVILNDDMEVISPDWIEQLLQFQQQDGVGVVAAKLLFPDGTIQHSGVTIIAGNPGHPYYRAPEDTIGHGGICTAVHNAVAVTGACSMTPKRLFIEIGGYDDSFESNYNDVDYCLRLIDAGYRIVMNPFAKLFHYESLSKDRDSGLVSEHLDLFHKKWRDKYQREPFMRCA